MTTASRLATIAGTCIASTLAVGLGGCAETERVTLNSLPVEVRAPLDNAMSYRGKVTEIERQVREEGPRVYVTYATVDNQEVVVRPPAWFVASPSRRPVPRHPTVAAHKTT